MIKVLIVDDHPVFRHGLRMLLEADPSLTFVGEAEDGLQAIEMAREQHPDVILMDLHMARLDGIQAARQILIDQPGTGIIMLTVAHSDEHVFAAIQVGIRGFLLKDTDEDALIRSIHAVSHGEALIDPTIAARVLKEFRRLNQAQNVGQDLTPLELDILKLVGEGLENPQIAKILNVSEKTVVNRLTVIYQKIGVTSRTQAALYALRKGLSSLQPEA